jgi:hypothetical protein
MADGWRLMIYKGAVLKKITQIKVTQASPRPRSGDRRTEPRRDISHSGPSVRRVWQARFARAGRAEFRRSVIASSQRDVSRPFFTRTARRAVTQSSHKIKSLIDPLLVSRGPWTALIACPILVMKVGTACAPSTAPEPRTR